MKDRAAFWTAAFAGLLHLAVANRYDLFRDELYFIVCGRHPSFGYADQPPLVPLLAAGTYALGAQTWLVRLPDVVAAMALAWLCVAFVRLLGGRDVAAWTVGLAVSVTPMFAGLTATLNTTTFEPLAWTAVAYLLARSAIEGDRRAPYVAGVVVGLALECKYAMPLWLVGLAIGLACTGERRIFRKRELWIGVALAAAIAAPSLVWQALEGLPFLELVHNAHFKDTIVAPLGFFLNQLLVYSPPFALLWVGGIAAPFFIARLRAVRFVAIGYVVAAIAIVANHGKDYYLAPAVPSLFVIGTIALEAIVASTRIRTAYAALAIVTALPLLPIALPILPPDRLVPYERALHLAPQQQERGDANAAFPSTFADMFGWHDFVRNVGLAYASIPLAQRRVTAIVVDNYGEAAALDLYGAPYGLPRALSGHNQYYLWGPVPDSRARNILRVQGDIDALRPYCASVRVFPSPLPPYARSFEKYEVIAYCAGLHPALSRVWPSLKLYI